MPLPRRSAPWWFLLCVTVAGALALRAAIGPYGDGAAAPVHAPPVAHAFLAFLILIGSLIWKGFEIAGRVTLEILKWVVLNLSLVVTKLGNGLKILGSGLLTAFKRAWDFTRRLYDDVLKPAWATFWRWFDKARVWLDRTFRPILDWLKIIKDHFVLFYKTWVRPWLDLIDVTRKLLRVAAALHIPFARQLDQRLGQLEALIEKPFRLVLAKINEVINIVNRVVTLDGLVQRVALIRSIQRDYLYAWRAIMQPYSRAVDKATLDKLRKDVTATTIPVVAADYRRYLLDGGGPDAPLAVEMAAVLRIYFKSGTLPTEL